MGTDDGRDALGLCPTDRAELLAATSRGGEVGALAALVLEWPPAPIRHVARFAGVRNVAGADDARVQKSARFLERLRPDRSRWHPPLPCPLCERSAEQIRSDAIHGDASRARTTTERRYRDDGAPAKVPA